MKWCGDDIADIAVPHRVAEGSSSKRRRYSEAKRPRSQTPKCRATEATVTEVPFGGAQARTNAMQLLDAQIAVRSDTKILVKNVS